MSIPTTKRDIQFFLGMAEIIGNLFIYLQVRRDTFSLVKKWCYVYLDWGLQRCFETLKNTICTSPVLVLTDFFDSLFFKLMLVWQLLAVCFHRLMKLAKDILLHTVLKHWTSMKKITPSRNENVWLWYILISNSELILTALNLVWLLTTPHFDGYKISKSKKVN